MGTRRSCTQGQDSDTGRSVNTSSGPEYTVQTTTAHTSYKENGTMTESIQKFETKKEALKVAKTVRETWDDVRVEQLYLPDDDGVNRGNWIVMAGDRKLLTDGMMGLG